MELKFWKYQATGNDFLLVENLDGHLRLGSEIIQLLCDRHFGVGADGLIIVERREGNWHMLYYNADGHLGSFCGNGSRAFALHLCSEQGEEQGRWFSYTAFDGLHWSRVISADFVETRMRPVAEPSLLSLPGVSGECWFVDSGSPHVVIVADKHPFWMKDSEFEALGAQIRWSTLFSPGGVNVNLAWNGPEGWYVRTYERGVEAETLSCGTGVVAVACVARSKGVSNRVDVVTRGGHLMVDFENAGPILRGPARKVFKGVWA
ncbi:MAG: diaminopimelate epimerase [Flavobacteriales bacterium]|nr:diaminopimelate epimerase [Flavobacteriales bacterium]